VGKETASSGGGFARRVPGVRQANRVLAILAGSLTRAEGSSGPQDYDAALANCERSLGFLQELHDREALQACELVTDLLLQPLERQRIIVENNQRFYTWGVLARLLDQSWSQSLLNPAAVEHFARLALFVADRLDTSFYRPELTEDFRARAWSYIGNAYRQRSDLTSAQDAFRIAKQHLGMGTGDPLERAILLDLEASLLRAQRKFDRAMSLLRRCHTIFLSLGDRHRAGRALVNMETTLQYAGSPELGIPLLYQALDLIDSQREPWLVLYIWHNLVMALVESGRIMEARRLFVKTRSLYPKFPEAVTQNRRSWLAGKIARGSGQAKEAEALFLEARKAFVADEAPYDVALVSLEVASIYAEQGRLAELKQLAAEIMPVFSSRRIHREALMALAYWKQAVEAESASERVTEIAGIVAEVSGFLKRARYDPDLRFTPLT
jgi:tetratricopeptide (TPR) repeat protein